MTMTDEQITLDDYLLEAESRVRFLKLGKTQAYWEGEALWTNDDGSIEVRVNGTTRSIYPSRLEKEVIGPRGGRSWVPVIDG